MTATNRVAEHTPPHVNAEIRRTTEASVTYCAKNPDLIERRLEELQHEWDIERVLEANASILTLYGLVMGLVGRRYRLLVLPLVVAGFLLQHAIQGWCPPVSLLRRLGIRTRDEILFERYALRALRGDLNSIGETKEREMHERSADILRTLEE